MAKQTAEEKKAYLVAWGLRSKEKISAYQAKYTKDNNKIINEKKAIARQSKRQENRDYSKAYYHLNKNERIAYAKGYRDGHKDAVNERSRKWREENKELSKKLVRDWAKRNPEADRRHHQLRRARKALAEGKMSKGLTYKLMELQNGECVYCKKCLSDGYHIDHKTPLSRGGSNEDSNIQLLCSTCNLKKHTKTHEEFYVICIH